MANCDAAVSLAWPTYMLSSLDSLGSPAAAGAGGAAAAGALADAAGPLEAWQARLPDLSFLLSETLVLRAA